MKVFVGDIKTGMRLAEDVKGANGRFLLAAGTVIEEQHLRVFNIWGVSEVEVEGSGGGENDSDFDPALVERAEEYAGRLFANVNKDSEPVRLLKGICVKRYAGMLSENLSLPPLPEYGNELSDIPEDHLYADAAAFMTSGIRLSSFPDIYYKIMNALNDPTATSESLADIISKDSGLSAKLISLVNSPLYGFSLPVESLSRAVSLVGTSGLCQLALSVSVMESFKGSGADVLSMADFWKHSLACAVFCRIFASQIPGTSQDKCFVVGMLHDLGRLVLMQHHPDEISLTFRLCKFHGLTGCQAEVKVFGFDHCQLAGELFEHWNFPPSLIVGVAGHHGDRSRELSIESAICSVADMMAVAMQYGSDGPGLVGAPYPGAWDVLGLPGGALATSVLKARRQITDILAIFGG
ncbi:HDOD domain-containing protein [Maridesulfovibrio sp.]|uniref:HDOD domain-containing protein n=1 Tax=Maridesulfovibrio sp. TaxID=2795000 RepID=UPI002AA68275|nr:HDOD domain-containing protein [Maridesulfovibrio sp.]